MSTERVSMLRNLTPGAEIKVTTAQLGKPPSDGFLFARVVAQRTETDQTDIQSSFDDREFTVRGDNLVAVVA